MIKIYTIILSIFIFPNGADTCECAPHPNWKKATPKEFEYVEDVFIGDVTICNETEFEIKVCEVFKGNLKAGDFIKGENIGYCGPYVDKNGEWVLFVNYSNSFKVNDCGLSSNIAEPFGLFPPPPPPEKDIKYNEKKVIKEWKVKLKKSIKKQIIILRNISESKKN